MECITASRTSGGSSITNVEAIIGVMNACHAVGSLFFETLVYESTTTAVRHGPTTMG